MKKMAVLSLSILLGTSAFAGGLGPVTIIKCVSNASRAHEVNSGEIDTPITFKMVIFENEYREHPGQHHRTVFRGNFDGSKVKAEGVTNRIGYTANHKAVFETTFPKESSDMRFIAIRFVSGSIPWSAIEKASLNAPPLGGIPASLPLTCRQSYSFRY